MEPLIMIPKDDSPKIILNKAENTFLIQGNSFLEDPVNLYAKVLYWLEEYKNAPNDCSVFNFKLNYVNTASSKMISEILASLSDLSAKSEVVIKWHYQQFDDDMLFEGQELASIHNLVFEFIEY